MMNIVIINVITLVLAYSLTPTVNIIIKYKEKKRHKSYPVFRNYHRIDPVVDMLILLILNNAALFLFSGINVLVPLIMIYLTVLLFRIDQRVRIIPNEAVLLILIITTMSQLYRHGFVGLVDGLYSMIYVGLIFILSGYLLKSFTGTFGVGLGDIKLSMALACAFDISNVNNFLIGIVCALLIYVVLGYLFKKITLKSTFPMAIQIMSGYLIASSLVPYLM